MIIQSIYIEITNHCNLNCRTCYNRSGLNRKTHELTLSEIRAITDRFRPYGLQRVLLAGGEPTLHSDFDHILDWIDQTDDLSFGIVTNGTVFNEKLIALAHRCDRLTLQISMDGSSETVNAATRGKGHFEKVMRFVDALDGAAVKPLLKAVLSQQNADDVENYYKLALAKHCIPEFAFIYRSGNGEENWNSKALTAQQKLHIANRIRALNAHYGIEAFTPRCSYVCPFAGENAENDIPTPTIKTNGSIQPCQLLYDPRYTLANVLDFDAIRFEQALLAFVRLAQKRRQHEYACRTCLLQGQCGKGCPATAIMLHGDPFTDDGDCAFRRLEFVRTQFGNITAQTFRFSEGEDPHG